MILKKVYDEKEKKQKVWYDSTMLLYSEMVEYDDANKGDLYVTFKNGTTYKYTGVAFEDYIVFIGGGTDASQGKALNKVIKNKYEYEKVNDAADVQKIMEELNKTEEESIDVANTYFISGHRNITDAEFEFNYEPLINLALRNPNANFVVGDCDGVDIKAQNYLMDIVCIDPSKITVYHMLDTPRNINPLITKTKGGFQSDEERDAAMTLASSEDIALVRDDKKISGTAQNILRRHLLKTF